jgi:hypothetical protein
MSTAKNRMLVGEFGSSRIDLKVRPHWHYQTQEQKRAVLNDLFLRQKEIRNPIGGSLLPDRDGSPREEEMT